MRPNAREGHAASSWGPDGQDLILFGGWGSGTQNDLFILERQGHDFRWHRIFPDGPRPVTRHGHSVTRCGPDGDMLLVYGGMQARDYQSEIEALAVLRRNTKPGVGRYVNRLCLAYKASDIPTRSASVLYEWVQPELQGARPQPRGYHAACSNPDGRLVYLFGGIADDECCNTLAVVNVETWECELPTTHGEPPRGRFGCSMAVWCGGLWVVGGARGNDVANGGRDLRDVWRLDLSTLTWEQPQLANQPHDARVMGRCHASCLVGSKLVLFGGSLDLGNSITWLDLDARAWGQPTVMGAPPPPRMSAVMTRSGDDLLVFGGWVYPRGVWNDLYRLSLDPSEEDCDTMRQMAVALHGPHGSGHRSAAAGGSSNRGGAGGEPSRRGAGASRAGHAGSSSMTDAGSSAAAPAAYPTAKCGVQAFAVPTDEEVRLGQGCLPRGLLQPAGGEGLSSEEEARTEEEVWTEETEEEEEEEG